MKKFGFLVLALIVLGAIIYVTFVVAVIKAAFGIILLVIAAILLWFLWTKLKDKVEDTF